LYVIRPIFFPHDDKCCEARHDVDACSLAGRGWLYRKIILGPPANVTIEYDGCGLGYESERVNGQVVAQGMSWFWFVPRFDFTLPTKAGLANATMAIRVWPWFALRHVSLRIDGKEVYAEGSS